ncbi:MULTISPECIES: hypothetical protein [Thioclava]|uniref:Uncharacterized protein n=1 Tax=Thioclava litoralis TaxID=3076557 RepID=A0ABZ1E575_9RHOB|nr:hypothetical protein RPE78_16695 [Thioclava sp. FTW29]
MPDVLFTIEHEAVKQRNRCYAFSPFAGALLAGRVVVAPINEAVEFGDKAPDIWADDGQEARQ